MPRSQGHNASMRAMASAAVSSCGQIGSCAGATDLAFRKCRFRARARPPRRPMLRHWSMVRLKRIPPRSRFMAPRFIDRVGRIIKRIMRAGQQPRPLSHRVIVERKWTRPQKDNRAGVREPRLARRMFGSLDPGAAGWYQSHYLSPPGPNCTHQISPEHELGQNYQTLARYGESRKCRWRTRYDDVVPRLPSQDHVEFDPRNADVAHFHRASRSFVWSARRSQSNPR